MQPKAGFQGSASSKPPAEGTQRPSPRTTVSSHPYISPQGKMPGMCLLPPEKGIKSVREITDSLCNSVVNFASNLKHGAFLCKVDLVQNPPSECEQIRRTCTGKRANAKLKGDRTAKAGFKILVCQSCFVLFSSM